ncbi:formylglycine-generating enzyme family protein [Halomonas sp. V046]|uniref:formylglycine-generating enzyme family protein n=1 Tax=Halomonas sp. V046 TaxID=3459611 RepID=UPI004044C187
MEWRTTVMSRSSAGIVSVVALALTACDDSESNQAPDVNEPANQQAVEALIQKTMDNMVFVEGGSFEMGDFGPIDPKAEGLPYTTDTDNKPLHTVTLDSYSIAAHQVSYADYDIYSEATGREKINTEGFDGKYRAPDVPAGVDWYQARDYCQWLAEQTGVSFALPTEAQWEYAARSRGGFYPFATNDGLLERGRNFPTLDEVRESTPANEIISPHTIALYPSNPLGTYQMGTNGFEWVSDWYDENYYNHSPKKNPKGPDAGEFKVRRGSSFGETGRAKLTINRRIAYPNLSITQPNPALTKEPSYDSTFRCATN